MVGPAESRRLNSRYRGRDRATNVLSFPAAALPAAIYGAVRPLGDLVICPQVLRTEAREQRKSLRAHWAHLVVHGALHLIGYDHERDADATRMERREIRVLRRLGFANPYRSS
jgi:probable rRNA maturation factor